MHHSLIEIPREEWPQLRDLYAHKQTESVGYNSINNFITWTDKEPQLQVKCYALDGDWQNDGTYVMTANYGGPTTQVFFNTLTEQTDRLITALKCLETKDSLYLLFGYNSRLLPAIETLEKSLPKQQRHKDRTVWHYASKDLVKSFSTEPPNGITLANLTLKDVNTVNNEWPHRHEGSEMFIERMILHSVNVGAYDADGRLVAWCLRLPIGSLGLLQVLDTHKRLGLGSLMVRCMSKKISELGDEVMAPVVDVNNASRKMFQKLGFQEIDSVYWSTI